MKILIVGNTSAIGKAFAARFKPDSVVRMAGRNGADISLDLTDWKSIPAIQEQFDAVIHVAADFGGPKDQDFIRAEMVNAVGTLSVCRLAKYVQAQHLVYLSSISAGYLPDNPYFGIYALSKRHGEEVSQLFCSSHGITLSILRATQVYDAEGQCRKHQPLLYTMADNAEAGRDIFLHGRHDAKRNYIFIDDLSEICYRVVSGQQAGIYTCSNPQSVTLSEVAYTAFDIFKNGGRVHFLPERESLADLVVDNDHRLYELISYFPRTDIRTGFGLIKSYRETKSC